MSDDARIAWFRQMAEYFGECGSVYQDEPIDENDDVQAYWYTRLAAHFGRLALGETHGDETWVRRRFRQELWVNHGCDFHALYGDDGEMQCHACHVDFKREPIEELVPFVEFRRMKRVADALAAQAALDKYHAGANAEEQAK